MDVNLSKETADEMFKILIDDVNNLVNILEEQNDYIEFLEELIDDVDDNNKKEMARKNVELKKALNLAESLVKFGIKNEGQSGKTNK